mgnify:CR=1 FL=1|tara:strand:+ start:115 stop:1140 length:1026 start_codon:yes stop_codon:yes gene_type:complete
MIKRNILITCSGGIYTRSIVNAIEENNKNFSLVLCDSNENSLVFAKTLNKKIYLVSSAEIICKDKFINEIRKIVYKEKITHILPMSDKEAFYLKNSEFESITLCADKRLCNIFSNKYSTIINLNKIINQKSFIKIINNQEVESLVRNLDKKRIYCIKPNNGRGGRGFKIIGKKKFFKGNLEKFLEFEQLHETLSKDLKTEYIIMDYFEGEDFNIDVSCNNGMLIDISIQRRDAPLNGPINLGKNVNDKLIYDFIAELVSKLKASGVFNVELIKLKINEKEIKPVIYEINPRASAAISFTEALNPGFIERSIKVIEGLEVEPMPFFINRSVNIRRVWINEIV